MFEFACQYVQQIYSDPWLTKKLKNSPGTSFFQPVTPSDITYIISLLKNGQRMWNQEINIAENHNKGDEEKMKKAQPQFTSGMCQKQSCGVSL